MTNKQTLLYNIFLFFLLTLLSGQSLEHEVQRGDTLYSLSRKYDVSIDEIMSKNGISSANELKLGIILQIPQNNLENSPDNVYIKSSEHFVKKGDTLYSISRSNGMSVSELLELNGLSEGHVLHIGEKLLLKKVDTIEQPVKTVMPNTIERGSPVSSSFWPIEGIRYRMDGKLQGVRINADAYSYVRSIASGKVVLAEPYRGFGNVILIDVNGYIYLYGGNEDIFVNVGEEVAAGTRIGRLGMSDSENGKENMFFSVFKDGKPVDTNTAPRG